MSVSTKQTLTSYPEEFESFWKAFPATRRTKKREAFRRWKLASKRVDSVFLTEKAKEYADSPKGRSEYAVMPSVWLNSGMWEDSPESWDINNSTGGLQQREVAF